MARPMTSYSVALRQLANQMARWHLLAADIGCVRLVFSPPYSPAYRHATSRFNTPGVTAALAIECLFRLEAGFLDHPLPAREVFLDEVGEPLGLTADRLHPLADELGAYVRLLQDAVDLGAQLGHDRSRRTGWRENAVPALDRKIGKAQIAHG